MSVSNPLLPRRREGYFGIEWSNRVNYIGPEHAIRDQPFDRKPRERFGAGLHVPSQSVLSKKNEFMDVSGLEYADVSELYFTSTGEVALSNAKAPGKCPAPSLIFKTGMPRSTCRIPCGRNETSVGERVGNRVEDVRNSCYIIRRCAALGRSGSLGGDIREEGAV